MTKPELIYFPLPGRAALARVALVTAGIDFTDTRLKGDEAKVVMGDKIKCPTGLLPVLVKADGSVLTQSLAIARWAGAQSHLYPVNNTDALGLVDEILGTAEDTLTKAPKSADAEELKAKREEFAKGFLTRTLQYLDAKLEGKTWFCGDKMTLADLAVANVIGGLQAGFFDHVPKTIAEPYANLMRLKKQHDESEEVKKTIAKLGSL